MWSFKSRMTAFARFLELTAIAMCFSAKTEAETVEVVVRDLAFEPRQLTIRAGDTVQWVWGSGFHTVTSGKSSNTKDKPGELFRAVIDNAEATLSYTFAKPGEYPYFCEPHESANMKGKVIVTDAAATETASAKLHVQYAHFNDSGQLLRPEGYRSWPHVGTPITPHDKNGGQAPFSAEFHSVYMDPRSWKVYEETGTFPEGTVLVKELITVGARKAASGKGYFMGDFTGLVASVKDSGRFADEPNYWAYFSFSNPDDSLPYKNAAPALPAASCNACHKAYAGQDMVFTQYYPVLRAMREATK